MRQDEEEADSTWKKTSSSKAGDALPEGLSNPINTSTAEHDMLLQDKDETDSTRKSTCSSEAGDTLQQQRPIPSPVQKHPTGQRSSDERAAAEERHEEVRLKLVAVKALREKEPWPFFRVSTS
eukprot:209593-Rhodomonas_salina.1